MTELDELLLGTKKVYNCCDIRAMQIIADRANTNRIHILKQQIKENADVESRNDETRNAE